MFAGWYKNRVTVIVFDTLMANADIEFPMLARIAASEPDHAGRDMPIIGHQRLSAGCEDGDHCGWGDGGLCAACGPLCWLQPLPG
jgi:hypothetical protein